MGVIGCHHGWTSWAQDGYIHHGWTLWAQDGYITTTAHYLDDNWTQQTRALYTNVLQEAHNGAKVGAVLKETSEKWRTNQKKGSTA